MSTSGWAVSVTAALAAVLTAVALLLAIDGISGTLAIAGIGLVTTAGLSTLAWTKFLKFVGLNPKSDPT